MVSTPTGPATSGSLDLDIVTALRRGQMACTSRPISCFFMITFLIHIIFYYFLLSSFIVPTNVNETLSNLGWWATMGEEMSTLVANGTWTLIPSTKHSIVGCNGCLLVNAGHKCCIDRLKAR